MPLTDRRHTISGIGKLPRVLAIALGIIVLEGNLPRLRADMLKIYSQQPFENVTIVDFSNERVVFRGLSGETLRIALRRVEQLALDRSPAFTGAEEARARSDFDRAVPLYDTALRAELPGSLHELMRIRRAEAVDRSGRFDVAVGEWLDLLSSAPSLAQASLPQHPGKPGSQSNLAARNKLEAAASKAAGTLDSTSSALPRRLWLELLIYDEVEPLPPEFRAKPSASQPFLFARSQPTNNVELPAESLVFAAAEGALRERDFNRVVRLLEPSIGFAARPAADLQRLRLGQARIEIGQFANAVNDLMPVIDGNNRDLSVQALYYVGLAHERLGRRETARRYYQQALDRRELPADLDSAARTALERIGD